MAMLGKITFSQRAGDELVSQILSARFLRASEKFGLALEARFGEAVDGIAAITKAMANSH